MGINVRRKYQKEFSVFTDMNFDKHCYFIKRMVERLRAAGVPEREIRREVYDRSWYSAYKGTYIGWKGG